MDKDINYILRYNNLKPIPLGYAIKSAEGTVYLQSSNSYFSGWFYTALQLLNHVVACK